MSCVAASSSDFDALHNTVYSWLQQAAKRAGHDATPVNPGLAGQVPHGQTGVATIDEAAPPLHPMMHNFNYPRFNLNPERAGATSASNHAGHSNPPA